VIIYFRVCLLSLAGSFFGHRESLLLLAAFTFILWTARWAHLIGREL
jgi:hypothetical protein